MPFERWHCAWPRTWPYALFKKHHTELNDLYWSNAAAASHALYTTAKALPADPVAATLAIPIANARRVNYSTEDWKNKFKEFENWTRLNALMALCGYLETYLHAISTLALTSNPGLLISSPRAVDGIALVKRKAMPDLSPHLTSLTKGSWPSRLQAYIRLFKTAPNSLSSNVSELDAMRKLRNGVGHSFGRQINDYRSPLLMMPLPAQRLSEERLQKWLGVVDDAVNGIEEHLRQTHVGAIEVLLNYHDWDKRYPAGHTSEERALRSRFPDAQGNPPTAAYFLGAIRHYNGS